jgi:hypothetical protein
VEKGTKKMRDKMATGDGEVLQGALKLLGKDGLKFVV